MSYGGGISFISVLLVIFPMIGIGVFLWVTIVNAVPINPSMDNSTITKIESLKSMSSNLFNIMLILIVVAAIVGVVRILGVFGGGSSHHEPIRIKTHDGYLLCTLCRVWIPVDGNLSRFEASLSYAEIMTMEGHQDHQFKHSDKKFDINAVELQEKEERKKKLSIVDRISEKLGEI